MSSKVSNRSTPPEDLILNRSVSSTESTPPNEKLTTVAVKETFQFMPQPTQQQSTQPAKNYGYTVFSTSLDKAQEVPTIEDIEDEEVFQVPEIFQEEPKEEPEAVYQVPVLTPEEYGTALEEEIAELDNERIPERTDDNEDARPRPMGPRRLASPTTTSTSSDETAFDFYNQIHSSMISKPSLYSKIINIFEKSDGKRK
ncbi:MAG TPA: hypothetical protein VGJ00_05720 [Rhabdochlamydiaceae bacterium]|jgi:hypothetical protein